MTSVPPPSSSDGTHGIRADAGRDLGGGRTALCYRAGRSTSTSGHQIALRPGRITPHSVTEQPSAVTRRNRASPSSRSPPPGRPAAGGVARSDSARSAAAPSIEIERTLHHHPVVRSRGALRPRNRRIVLENEALVGHLPLRDLGRGQLKEKRLPAGTPRRVRRSRRPSTGAVEGGGTSTRHHLEIRPGWHSR